jgi:hypothetical protein
LPSDCLHHGKEEDRAERAAAEFIRDRSFRLLQSMLFKPLRQFGVADLSAFDPLPVSVTVLLNVDDRDEGSPKSPKG